jgi:DinB family protein
MVTDPELKEYEHQLAQIDDAVRSLLTGLNDQQLNWRPGADRWSIGECLVHLAIAGEVYAPVLDQGIASARAAGYKGQGPFRYRWLDRTFVRYAEPPPRFRLKTPRTFVPTPPTHTVRDVAERFARMQNGIRTRLQAANGLDLKRQRVTSPASARVTISLGAAFALLAAHERRHVWQATRVQEAPGFPH